MNYGQVSPGYGMQQPMQPQQIVVIQQQPMMQQPVQQQVKHVELKGIPQNLQCPQCKKMVVSKVKHQAGDGTWTACCLGCFFCGILGLG